MDAMTYVAMMNYVKCFFPGRDHQAIIIMHDLSKLGYSGTGMELFLFYKRCYNFPL